MTDKEQWGFAVYIAGMSDGFLYGPYDSREEAEAEAREACKEHHTLCPVCYEIGRLVRYSPFLKADVIYDYLYEDAEEQLWTYPPYGEMAPDDERIFDQIDAKRDELAECVSNAIRAWMDDNGIATDRLVIEHGSEFVEVRDG